MKYIWKDVSIKKFEIMIELVRLKNKNLNSNI